MAVFLGGISGVRRIRRTKEDYLNIGKDYLKLKTTLDQWKFGLELEKKIPKAKFRIFDAWINTVNDMESHRNTKEDDQFYINFLSRML